jgi:hypothetical protein
VLSSRLELTSNSKEGERSAHQELLSRPILVHTSFGQHGKHAGLENICPFLAVNYNIVINFNLGTRQSQLAKHVCKHKVNNMAKPRKSITLPRSKFQK